MYFTAEEYAARVDKVSQGMSERGLDVLIAFANYTMPGHVRYLAGFETRHGHHTATMFAMAPGARDPYLLLTNAFWEPYQEESWVENTVLCSSHPGYLSVEPHTPPTRFGSTFGMELVRWLPHSAKRIGVAGYEALPAPTYIALREAFPDVEITGASDLVFAARAIKSPAEVETIRHLAHIGNQGAQAFLDAIAPGRTEREILAEVEKALTLAGSNERAGSIQLYSGPRTAVGVSLPTDRCVEPGDVVQLDCQPTYHGYQGDVSRCAPAGRISDMVRRVLDVTAEMYWRCVDTIRPGVRCSDVANVAMEVARRHGMERYLYRSPNVEEGYMGHGIGCRCSEPPVLDARNDSIICENMTLVLEPILGIPGVAGAKLEDVVWVTADGVEHFAETDLEPWKH